MFYAFFNVNTFYGKLGKQYGTFYLFTINFCYWDRQK